MKRIGLFWMCVLLAAVTTPSFSQISEGGTPPSFLLRLNDAVPTVKMMLVDREAYLAEDAKAGKDVPFRFAAELDVSLNLKNSGVWTEFPNGDRLWRLRIQSDGAFSLGLVFSQWYIPEGGKLFIYNDDHSRVTGAFTHFNNWEKGTNITAPVAGDAITMEYLEPASVTGQTELSVFRVTHAYRNLFGRDGTLDAFGSSGSCNNNVVCPEGAAWQNDKRGVAMILESGSRICTGSLINNTAQNLVPYFLTAYHCWSSSATGWVFMFNYESPTCANADGPTYQTVTNATDIARWSTSDFCLMQLSSTPPSSYNVYYNGWNRNDSPSTSSVGIHHPAGDVKKISFDMDASVSSGYLGASGSDHWRIVAWNDGTTEGGSSGSPLFDQNHRITGQLHGGYASCTSITSDYYGKLATSWNGGGTPTTRLSIWLDPSSTGATTLDGTAGGVFAITVTKPNTAVTWVVGDPDTIKWTTTGTSENVILEMNRSYPGATWETIATNVANTGSYLWTMTTPTSAAARIRVRGYTHTTVGDTSDVNFAIGTRSVTVTKPNGGETWIVGDQDSIKWSGVNFSETVKIEINRSYPGATWTTLAASAPNLGYYLWTMTSGASTTARVRVSGVTHTGVSDTSNANFTISDRSVTVTVPNGGETWLVGDVNTIQWTSVNLSENVKVELNRSYPSATWETLTASTTNSGSFAWTVTGTLNTSTARIRISGISHTAIGDSSNANFSIGLRAITVTAPNGGETRLVGEADTVKWTSANLAENVKIELNRAYPGATWETMVDNVANSGSYIYTVTGSTTTTARVRISGVTHSTIADTSNANYAIAARTLSLASPNGGENWLVGDASSITWTSANLSENVRVLLNRNYPSGTWDTLASSIANSGSYAWTVTAPTTSTARVRVEGVIHSAVSDFSDAEFNIGLRSLAVLSPNGGELWYTGDVDTIKWTSLNLTGNVKIELDRDYPSATWETIVAATANDGVHPWTLSGSVTTAARIRITGVSYPTVGDTSDANFTMASPNQAPVIVHDPLDDQNASPFVVTAIVTDDAPGFGVFFEYKLVSASGYETQTMTPTVNANEFSASMTLAEGTYDYDIRVLDAGGRTTITPTYHFTVGYACGTEQAYDDGTAERSNWAAEPGFRWAVKFNGNSSFVLCGGRIGISADHPTTSRSPIRVEVYNANGAGGLPGTLLYTKTIGSIGNVIGGVTATPANWATVLFRDEAGEPLVLTGDFYVAVSNPDSLKYESFLEDTSSARAGRSVVFSSCANQWYDELAAQTVARPGNRMIRVSGFTLAVPTVVIRSASEGIHLNWTSTGAPYYKIYSASSVNGPYETYLGSVSDTSFLDLGGSSTSMMKFYEVRSSTKP